MASSGNSSPVSRWLPAFVFLPLALGIAGIAFYAFEGYQSQVKKQVQTSLLLTAQYKVQQLHAWRTRFLTFGAAASDDPLLARELQQWSARGYPADAQGRLIAQRLRAMEKAYGLQAVFWFDKDGVVRLGSNPAAPPPTAYGRQVALEAMRGREPVLTDLHFRDKKTATDIVVDLLVPIFAPDADGQGEVIGALYIRIDPHKTLYPLILNRIGDKATEETFLAKREGDRILYLSELRGRPNSALRYSAPARPDLLATLVTEGRGKVMEGTDYLNIPSLGAGLGIPDTPWILVTKVAREEVLAPIRERAVMTGGIVLLLLISAGSVSMLAWKVQRARASALEQARQAADAANRAKSAFLSAMSHEIRTPLNAILGIAHLCLQTELTDKQRDYVLKTHRAGKLLLGLINDILDFSKIEAGRLDLEEADFDLNDNLANIESILGHTAREKGLDFRIEVGADVPRHLRGDPLRLGQVLLNLVSNAVKFTDKGSVLISVALRNAAWNTVELEFSVRDTGIGLTPEQAEQLFQPFSQADITTTRKYGGTGLGLAISRRLVELMGGRIWLESAPGQGSDFRFAVPLGRGLEIPAGDAITQACARTSQSRLQGARILLVEDNTFNQEVGLELLEAVGAAVTVAGDGREALACLGEAAFDAVLMDVHMPVMDGYEATRRIRKMPGLEHLPVIALTANATQEEHKRCLAVGMDDFIAKPIDPNHLYLTLAKRLPQRPPTETETDRETGADASIEADVPDATAGTGTQAVIDLAFLGRMVRHDPARIRKFAFKFIETTHEILAEMDAAHAHGDLATLGGLAHKLKSSARTVGALGFADLCQALEAAAKANDGQQAGKLHSRLPPLLERIAHQIEHELGGTAGTDDPC